MFEGYLEVGGWEIFNNARAQGYAATANCRVPWVVEKPCDGIQDAVNEDIDYIYENISDAPWYDDSEDATGRFLGVLGLKLDGISDSTRDAVVAEGVGDGGTVGQLRYATRRVRAEAMLTANGQDALEAGLSWLKSALRVQACRSHGDACGSVDMRLFTACPPSRDSVTKPDTVWSDPITNLATNPSFEATTAGTVEARRNLALSPQAAVTPIAGWNFSPKPASGSWAFTATPGVAVGTAPGGTTITTCYRKAWTAVEGAQPGDGISYNLRGDTFTRIPVTAGDLYAVSFWVRPSWPLAANQQNIISLKVYTASSGGSSQTLSSAQLGDIPANVWTRLSATFTIPAGFTHVEPTHTLSPQASAGSWPIVGSTFDATGLLVENTPAVLDYFDGGTISPDPDLTAAWSGTVNASASVLTGVAVAGVVNQTGRKGYASADWVSTGLRSLKILGALGNGDSYSTLPVTLAAGATYTILGRIRLTAAQTGTLYVSARSLAIQYNGSTQVRSTAAPNAAGVYDIRWTVTIPAGATGISLRAYNGAAVGGGDVWWDDILVMAGSYTGPYFDGSTPDTADPPRDYAWTGTADASTSTARSGSTVQVEDPEAYQEILDSLERNLHSVTCVSGPTVIQKFHHDDAWGYLVEFVLVAAAPSLYGVTRNVVLDTGDAVVIQDAPTNLVLYPSAVLTAGTVTVAVNYADNPSVETNLTHWSKDAGSVAAQTVLAQSDTAAGGIAAVGTKSARARFTATTTSAVAGTSRLDNQSATFAARVAGDRMSVSMWASANLFSGTAVLGTLKVFAIWQAGATVLRTDTISSSVALAGGVASLKGIAVPATATNVILRAELALTSWSTGAVVDLFADAVAVTVP